MRTQISRTVGTCPSKRILVILELVASDYNDSIVTVAPHHEAHYLYLGLVSSECCVCALYVSCSFTTSPC
jgi:hypothetical protein